MTEKTQSSEPVTQITLVEPEPGKQAEAVGLMTERARFMARQPGFLSIELHRSLDGTRIVNCIRWESRELLQSAHRSPEFRQEWSRFDSLTGEIDLQLYEPVDLAADRPSRT
ncbi:MAG: antibiotic biosynthesis monooxygenase family protein [Stellaceae bacterium]